MEGVADRGALDMLMSVTGASEAVATRLLQVNGGDLNAAVNSYYNESDELLSPEQRDDLERNDWMEEDEPAVGIPVHSAPPFGPLPLPGTRWDNSDLMSSRVAGQRGLPFATNTSPQVSHPPNVRNILIDWGDDDDAPSYPQNILSGPRIEEIPSNVDCQELPPNHLQAMVDDEVPSTASSVFRSGEHTTGAQVTYPDEELHPDFNPNAPHIAEVPVMSGDEGIDIEEEMLRAAIEASKREAEEASRRGQADYSQETTGRGYLAERLPSTRATEDYDLARAVTLSLKTAEEEKALRERGGASSDPVVMREDGENSVSEDVRKLDTMRRRGVARDRSGMARGASTSVGVQNSVREREAKGSGSGMGPIISSSPEEVDEIEEQPLLRRRTSRRSLSSSVESGLRVGETQARSQVAREPMDPQESPMPTTTAIGLRDEGGGATHASQDEDLFPSDEWGGISSEEHDEALMLEAALFGGLSERRALGPPYRGRRGIHHDLMDAFSDEGGNFMNSFSRRGFPQPPSPTVVAQRLIREQQDDEYLASLAADREKELKATEEAEAQRLKDLEAAEAAAQQEKVRQEEELKRQEEAEILERELARKKEALPLEPAAEEQGALTLVVRLPDGSRHGRRFHRSNKLQSLFDFIDIGGGVKPGTYRLVRQYPRVAFNDREHASSLEDLGLTSKQEVLFLELI